jgi:hypothetical protein
MSELRAFILKGEVIKLYRTFMRATKQAPHHSQGEHRGLVHTGMSQITFTPRFQIDRLPVFNGISLFTKLAEELRVQIREEFRRFAVVKDLHQTKYLLSDGRARLKQLEEMLGMQA